MVQAFQLFMGTMLLKNDDWYNCSKSGQETLEDKPRSGRCSTSLNAEIISKVKELVHANQRKPSVMFRMKWVSHMDQHRQLRQNYRQDEMIIHHDNAASHTAMALQQFLA
jgi:hypothetical protein